MPVDGPVFLTELPLPLNVLLKLNMTFQVKDIPTKAIDGQRTGSYELRKPLVLPDFGSQRVLTPSIDQRISNKR
jgi:hypothetical protein